MRVRLLFALVFVAIVGGLIVLRDQGYLGGRRDGGPFRLATDGVSAGGPADVVYGFGLFGSLHGAPVRVQHVRPRVVSPELEVLGPNRTDDACGACDFSRWPPTAAPEPLEDSEVASHASRALLGLRAQRPGLYYAVGLITDYRRGQRRFRDREPFQWLCIAIETRQRCRGSYRGPGAARVAQVGGPSGYRGAKLTEFAAIYGRPGEYRLRITLSNRTRSAIDVADLALDANRAGAAIVEQAPERMRLSPHGYEVVRLRLSVPACRSEVARLDRLRAKLDGELRSIPLSLKLRIGCG